MTFLILAGVAGWLLIVLLVVSWFAQAGRAGRACDRAVRRHQW